MRKTEKNLRISYKLYKNSTENPVDIKTYLLITGNYHKFLFDKVLEGETVTLPARLGTLSIIGKKQEISFDEEGKPKLPIDWVKTKQLRDKSEKARLERKVVYQTSDVRYKYLWSKKRVLVTNKMLYSLRVTRTNKRAVTKAIERGKEFLIKQ